MKQSVNAEFKGDMVFEADVNGRKFSMDSIQKKGVWPKPLLLVAICGCSGMDVVSILNKMQIKFDSLNIYVDANITNGHPSTYDKIHVVYKIGGEDLPKEKVEKAVSLSQEKYCGVLDMIKKAAKY